MKLSTIINYTETSTYGLLNEATAGRMAALLRTGIAKLQNLLTPNADTNLSVMLSIMAPDGGGIDRVTELVKQATTTTTSVLENDEWWDNLYDVFDLRDHNLRADIRDKIISEINPPQFEHDEQDEQDGLNNLDDFRSMLRRRLPNNHNSDNYDRPGRQQAEQVSSQKLAEIKQQIAQLKKLGQQLNITDVAEAIIAVSSPLTESMKYGQLRFIQRPSFKRVANNGLIDNWFDKFMKSTPVAEDLKGLVRNIRHFAANPTYSTNQLNNETIKTQNQRIAKLAVQLLTDQLRAELNGRLDLIGMDFNEMCNYLKEWQKLQTAYKATPDRSIYRQIGGMYHIIKRIVFAAQPDLAKAATAANQLGVGE